MIKPKIRHGKQCLEKRFSDLEEGEFFLHPDTGRLCITSFLDYNDQNQLVVVRYHDYYKNVTSVKTAGFKEFVQLVRVEIVYWLAEEKDLFQEKG